LITGLGHQQKPIRKGTVKEILRDFHGPAISTIQRKWGYAAGLAAALIVAGLMFQNSGMELLERVRVWTGVEQKGPENVAPKTADVTRTAALSRPTALQNAPVRPDMRNEHTVKRIVKRGATLSGLAREVYGKSDTAVIKRIQKANPQIIDPNLISEGSLITFPGSTEHKEQNHE
jgi:nucleoid-associated protein YgaU